MDLPDAENRMKILRIFLAQENLDPDFQFDKLANLTEGYSGSDLKVNLAMLCSQAYASMMQNHFDYKYSVSYICISLFLVIMFRRTCVLLQHIDLFKNS